MTAVSSFPSRSINLGKRGPSRQLTGQTTYFDVNNEGVVLDANLVCLKEKRRGDGSGMFPLLGGILEESQETNYLPGFRPFTEKINIRNTSETAGPLVLPKKTKVKRSCAGLLQLSKELKRKSLVSSRVKVKKETIPMRQRIFPVSFWQQPNRTPQASPVDIYTILPPLENRHSDETVTGILQMIQSSTRTQDMKPAETKYKVFESEKAAYFMEKMFSVLKPDKNNMKRKTKKSLVQKSDSPDLLNGNDPFLVENITEKFLPLSLNERNTTQSYEDAPIKFQYIPLERETEPTLYLPTMVQDRNYSKILSKIVEMI
ncbi:Hypothetical predicted protein [Octopus vulgaris]|uniref:Uncharacterized protein n=1 Tax=Octopus vulgaris TaxID=6645 RepID=A0AA36FIG3_OCTVU|nr:Hypothetical predicted protein [Octopus vulgaris]